MNVNIYKYLDYRQFFRDLYETRKSIIPSFSYRAFSRLAGSSSPNFFQLIVSRKLKISEKQRDTLAAALSLNDNEKAYFASIIAFDHAETHQEKDESFKKILLTRDAVNVKVIENRQYDYLTNWYNPVVRELATMEGCDGTAEWIAERIIPAVSVAKVKKSIALLETLGLMKNIGGKWLCSDSTVATPSEVLSVAAVTYHKEMISLAQDSIERFSAVERDIRSVTLKVSAKKREHLKLRLEAFWQELLILSEDEYGADEVVQINMQLYPLSVRKKGNTENE